MAVELIEFLQNGLPFLLVIRGERGSGRSTALSQVSTCLHDAEVSVLHARCHPDERGEGHGLLRQLRGGGGKGPEEPPDEWWQRPQQPTAPVAVLVDDLADADPASLQAVSRLCRHLDDRPVGVVITLDDGDRRAADLGAELTRLPYTRELALTPMSTEDEAAELTRMLRTAPSADALATIRETSRGNRGLVARIGQALTRDPDAATDPDTLHRVCARATWSTALSWIDRADPAAGRLYRSLLVLGPDAGVADAALLADLCETETARAERMLLSYGLLRGCPPAPVSEHREQHVELLEPALATTLHRRAAHRHLDLELSPRATAEQLILAGAELDRHDGALLRQSAHDALSTGDAPLARRALRHAMSRCADPGLSQELLLDLHRAQLHDDPTGCVRTLQSLAESGVPRDRLLRLLSSPAHLMLAAASRPLVDLLTQSPDDPGPSHADVAGHRLLLGLLTPPIRDACWGTPYLLIVRALALAASGRRREHSLHLLRRAVPGPSGLARLDPTLIGLAALAASWCEQPAMARLWASEGRDLAQRTHRPLDHGLNLVVRAMAEQRPERASTALDDARDARKLFDSVGAEPWSDLAGAIVAEVCRRSGRHEEAEQALAGLHLRADVHPLLGATVALALSRRDGIDPVESFSLLLECPRLLDGMGMENPAVLGWQQPMVGLLLRLDRSEAARALATETVDRARRWGAPDGVARALRSLDACRPSSGHAARPSQRDVTSAASADVRPRLSAAEQRVVDLVLQGHGNAEVARRLYLSKRTVDTHLGRIYRRLGINSRSQLAAALDESPR